MKPFLPLALIVFVVVTISCDPTRRDESTGEQSTLAQSGKAIFMQNCSGCHNFRQDGIGPQLGGVTDSVSSEWLAMFIRDPKKAIEAGDERAKRLVAKYHTVMPAFPSLTDREVQEVISYLQTTRAPSHEDHADTASISNPIPEPVADSGLTIELSLFCTIPASSDELPFTRIAKLEPHPNTAELYLLDLRGKLYHLRDGIPVVYLDMMELKPNFINKPGLATGFGSFAFHPEFEKNGLLYTTHTEKAGSAVADFSYADSIPVTLQWVITEWRTSNPASHPFQGTPRELFRVNMVTGLHGVQNIGFNPLAKKGDDDFGMLYIGVGDGASVENGYQFLVHTTERIWGTVLRIDPQGVNSANGRYGIPESNPFAKDQNTKTKKEIFAYGFRNPHLFTWTTSGLMLVSNIGHGNIESVNILHPGQDYGWPIREGTFALNPYGNLNKVFALPPDDSIYSVVYPAIQYDHDEGKAICGGFEYTGSKVEEMKDKYFFGDIPTGRLFYVDMSDIAAGKQARVKEWKISIGGKPTTLSALCGPGRVDLRLGRDASGEMYLFTKPDGKVYRLVEASKRKTGV